MTDLPQRYDDHDDEINHEVTEVNGGNDGE